VSATEKEVTNAIFLPEFVLTIVGISFYESKKTLIHMKE